MKRSYILALIGIAATSLLGVSNVFALAPTAIPSVAAPVIGSASWQTYGVLTFNFEVGMPGVNEVSINAQTGLFKGSFWSETVGWCGFDGLGSNTAKLTGTANIMPVVGYAWCQNAGWIRFDVGSNPVVLNKSTGKFSWFAWSESLGWMDLSGLQTDITPPDDSNFLPFAANGNKVFTLKGDPSDVVATAIAAGGIYTFEVDAWDDDTTLYKVKYPTASLSFTHDFRKAKDYNFRVTDPFGNQTYGIITVVAGEPSDALNAAKKISASATASTYTAFSGDKIANGVDTHSIGMNLRDQYGNHVITVPGIKTVTVSVAFNDTVDTDQSNSAWVLGDAIRFDTSEPFALAAGTTLPTLRSGSVTNSLSGDYSIGVRSYAPSKAGYAFTNNDNVNLTTFAYRVDVVGSNVGVGEVGVTSKTDKVGGTDAMKFLPELSIGTVTNNDSWAIRAGYDTTFSAKLEKKSAVALSNIGILNSLDIDTNDLISYQNMTGLTGGDQKCIAYNKTEQTFVPWEYTVAGDGCGNDMVRRSSQVLVEPTPSNLNGTIDFSWKPTIIFAAPATSNVTYTSQISYTNAGVSVKYPSYGRSTNSSLLADGVTATLTASWVVNQSVKIFGMSNGQNAFGVLNSNDLHQVGSLTRTDIRNLIHQNVALMTNGITDGQAPNGANFDLTVGGNKTLNSWPSGKDTIIVQGGNLFIESNIANEATLKGIIVIQDAQGNGGNIYIHKDVQNIAAVLYADKAIISGNGTTFYSDTRDAVKQLFLQGTAISSNTIGGASMTPLVCPYDVSDCTSTTAKRYDFDYFRFYTGATAAPWVPAGGEDYPFVIEYDSRIQTAPPPGFTQGQ